MTVRFDDKERVIELSVLDLVQSGAPRGDLVVEGFASSRARMAAGRDAHVDYQDERQQAEPAYRAEVTLRRQIGVGAWTVRLHGRVDGLTEEGGRPVVEEVKSSALDAARLMETTLTDWPHYVAQVEVYLWMVAQERGLAPVGRLIFVSLLDAARHVLGITPDLDRIDRYVRGQLEGLVLARERRLAWLASRRKRFVPEPFSEWRPGQVDMSREAQAALQRGEPLLVQAPTGLGKTAALLHGVLRHAMAHDKQVFWATARTTQQRPVLDMLARFRDAGLQLRVVTVGAKARICLNDVVACRPDRCRFAAGYHDKVAEQGLVDLVHDLRDGAPEPLADLARHHVVCPYYLALDASEEADVLIGDYNYVFDPSATLRRHFSEEPERWIVVVDEVHQLVDRARAYRSPRLSAREAHGAFQALEQRALLAGLDPEDSPFTPFLDIARDIHEAIDDSRGLATGRARDGVSEAELSATPWRGLADRLDELAIDYARLRLAWPAEDEDAFLDLGRAVQRFVSVLGAVGDETVHLVGVEPDDVWIGLLCLDPSELVGARVASLSGFIGCSATLCPERFYRELLGLHPSTRFLDVPSFFPREHRRVLVAPRVSTAWRDREAHAPATAELISACLRAVPGNVAVYFPSFAMLRDITGRWDPGDREALIQRPSMGEAERQTWLRRLGLPGGPVVLAAVLGGIFAEGIDLPPGALHAVFVAGPALPPVGLERDLLRSYYEDRYGEGFLYASLIPGMTRVVQAAGRLVRRPEDRGVVLLVGRRFRWREIAALLPESWDVRAPEDTVGAVAEFWEGA